MSAEVFNRLGCGIIELRQPHPSKLNDGLKGLEWKWQSNEPRHFHRIANGHLMCKNGWVYWQVHQRWELASYGKQMIPKRVATKPPNRSSPPPEVR